MIQDIRKFVKAFVSNAALEDAYEARRRIVLNKNNRSAMTVLVVGGILLGILAFVGGMIFIDRDSRGYLESRNRVQILDLLATDWKLAQIRGCSGKDVDCLPLDFTTVGEPQAVSRKDILNLNLTGEDTQYLRLQFTVPSTAWKNLSEYLTLAVSLPNMNYNKALVYLNGQMQRRFFLSRPIYFPLETKPLADSPLVVDLLIESLPTKPFKLGLSRPLFISTQHELEKFYENELLKTSGRGDWIALVSRITLALFAIALFLLVDSSSESLGLALFMGFEALGIAVKQNWLPLSTLGPWWDLFAASLFTNLGLIFRLYFFVNLARIGAGSISRWLTVGLLWAFPMALYAMMSANKPASAYPHFLNISSFVIGCAGIIICMRSYLFIHRMDLRWRRMALLSAAVANIPSLLISLKFIAPEIPLANEWLDPLNNLHFNSGFILALSAFFNISSLENRVRALTAAQTKAKQLEMELELGRSVQTQQLRTPSLPSGLTVDYYQSAASYVSGDTFFCHWDENGKVFTALLNDVTGHGVQAALKATICNVMADLLWAERGSSKHRTINDSMIKSYHQMIGRYLNDRFQMRDIHSICGFEFLPEEGLLTFYRANAPFPILIQPPSDPSSSDFVKVLSVPLKHAEVTTLKLNPGAIIILMSDGINFSSRENANIIRKLESAIGNHHKVDLEVDDVKKMIVDLTSVNGAHIDDDKTLFIFRWQPHAAAKVARVSA